MGGAFQPSNLSLYAYVQHNPATLLDLKGRESIVIGDRIYLRPKDKSVPAVDLPNTVAAKGVKESDWSFHDYNVPTPSNLRGPSAMASLGEGFKSSPTPTVPGKNNRPATPQGTENDVGPLPTGTNENFVRSFTVPSPDPSNYTDIMVNYTIAGRHTVHEGFVIRFGEKSPDGTITLRSYGEGNAWRQAPVLSFFWGPVVRKVWEQNHEEILRKIRDSSVPPR